MLPRRKRGVFAVGGLIVLIGAAVALIPLHWFSSGEIPVVADTLPASLDNTEFWRMIEEFSEPNGYFRSDNFLSNESGLQVVIPALKKQVKPGGAYIGVGPEQNFTYILAFEPKISFIVDIRRLNMLEHLMYKALFELSSDRADFVSRLFSRKRPAKLGSDASIDAIFDAYETATADRQLFETNLRAILDQLTLVQEHGIPLSEDDEVQIRYAYSAFFRSGPSMSYTFLGSYYQGSLGMPTYRQLMTGTDANERNWGFLSSEDRFKRLQAIQRSNLIVPLVGDFAGGKTLKAIAGFLKRHRSPLHVFYTSNVEMYLFQQDEDWKHFYNNVASLPTTPASAFIRFAAGRGRTDRIFGLPPQMWSPVQDLLTSYRAGKIEDYSDVIEMSR